MEPSSPRPSDLTYRQLMQLVSPRFKTAAPELPATRHYCGEIYGSPDKDISPDFNWPKSVRPTAKRTLHIARIQTRGKVQSKIPSQGRWALPPFDKPTLK